MSARFPRRIRLDHGRRRRTVRCRTKGTGLVAASHRHRQIRQPLDWRCGAVDARGLLRQRRWPHGLVDREHADLVALTAALEGVALTAASHDVFPRSLTTILAWNDVVVLEPSGLEPRVAVLALEMVTEEHVAATEADHVPGTNLFSLAYDCWNSPRHRR